MIPSRVSRGGSGSCRERNPSAADNRTSWPDRADRRKLTFVVPGANGTRQLKAWSSLPGEATLSWSARAAPTGWQLECAQLR